MPANPKYGKQQLEERREIIRSLLARGINKPTRIIQYEPIQEYYEGYKRPTNVIRKDIDAVRKENQKLAKLCNKEEYIGELISQFEESLQQAWTDYGKLEGRAKVSMLKVIQDIYKDLARIKGVDPEKIDATFMKIGDTVKGNKIVQSQVEADMEQYVKVAERVVKRSSGAEDQ